MSKCEGTTKQHASESALVETVHIMRSVRFAFIAFLDRVPRLQPQNTRHRFQLQPQRASKRVVPVPVLRSANQKVIVIHKNMAMLHEFITSGNPIPKINAVLDELPEDDPEAESELLNKRDAKDKNRTAIMVAAMHGEATTGSMLAECGADLDLKDDDGNTALHLTAIHKKRLVTSMLLWGGAEREAVNEKGNTALHEAVEMGCKDVAWLILENGGEKCLEIKNQAGETPLVICDRVIAAGTYEKDPEAKETLDELRVELQNNLDELVKAGGA